jgi:hypothetical protein
MFVKKAYVTELIPHKRNLLREPAETSPHPHTPYFFNSNLIIIPLTIRTGLPNVLFH